MLAAEPGKVNNQGQGYTTPNDLNTDGTYDFLENTVSPTFSVEPVDAVICPGNSASFTASSTQPGATFLWQKYNTKKIYIHNDLKEKFISFKVLPLADSTAKLWCLVNFENWHLGHPQ